MNRSHTVNRSSRRRSGHAFLLTSLVVFQLGSILLLSANSIATELSAIADTKAQYEEDLAEWRQDMHIHQNEVTLLKLDKLDFNVLALGLRFDVREYDDTYHPKTASFKSTTEMVNGKSEPKLVVDIDIAGIIDNLKSKGQAERDALVARAAALTAEARSLNTRQADLKTEEARIGARKMALDQRKAALDMMEQQVQQEELDEQCTVTTFDDSDLEAIEFIPDTELTTDVLDPFEDIVYTNGDDGP